MANRNCHKFLLLLWKLGKERRRNLLTSILQILGPPLLVLYVLQLKMEETVPEYTITTNTQTFDKEVVFSLFCSEVTPERLTLLYYPNNNLTEKIMNQIEKTVMNSIIPMCKIWKPIGFVTKLFSTRTISAEQVETFSYINISEDIMGLINFKLSTETAGLDYDMKLTHIYTYTDQFTPYVSTSDKVIDHSRSIWYRPHTAIQTLIDYSYIQIVTGKRLLPHTNLTGLDYLELKNSIGRILRQQNLSTSLEMMSLPKNTHYTFQLDRITFPFIVGLGPAVIFQISKIMQENQFGFKNMVIQLGIPRWMYWAATLFNYELAIVVNLTLSCVYLFMETFLGVAVFPFSSSFLFFFILFIYAQTLMSFVIMMSNLTESSSMIIIYTSAALLLPYMLVEATSSLLLNEVAFPVQLILCMIPSVNLYYTLRSVYALEAAGVGMQFTTLLYPARPGDSISLATGIIILLIQTAIFSILCIWFENGRTCDDDSYTSNSHQLIDAEEHGIYLHRIRKTFNNGTEAVKETTFSAEKGEITVILGHRGAGKSTLLSLISGFIKPTSGMIFIHGEEVSKGRDKIGVCLQNNMVLPHLNCWEHFYFFSFLKGLRSVESDTAADFQIEDLGLEKVKDIQVRHLNQQARRILNLGIALVADSQILLLDEPSHGMDLLQQKMMWDILIREKESRTIVMTSRLMEEAEGLADRIVVMHQGKIVCSGSRCYLNYLVGRGYRVSITLRHIDKLLDLYTLTKRIVPGVSVLWNGHQNQRIDILPQCVQFNENRFFVELSIPAVEEPRFPDLFLALEKRTEEFGIENMKVNSTRVEDAYLQTTKQNRITSSPVKSDSGVEKDRKRIEISLNVFYCQLYGLLIKRVEYTKKNMFRFLIHLLSPIIFISALLVLYNNTTSSVQSNLESLVKLDISRYNGSILLLQIDKDPTSVDIESVIRQLLVSHNLQVVRTDNITKTVLHIGRENLSVYRDRYKVGIQVFNSGWIGHHISGFFNNFPRHAQPIIQNLISNIILRYLDSPGSNRSITTWNRPLTSGFTGRLGPGDRFIFSLAISVWFLFLFIIFSDAPITEKVTGIKDIQTIALSGKVVYWIANFAIDMLMYSIVGLTVFIIIYLADTQNIYSSLETTGIMFPSIFLMGLSGIALAYALSTFFDNYSIGMLRIFLFYLMVGVILPIVNTSTGLHASFGVGFKNLLRWFTVWFPTNSFQSVVQGLYEVQRQNIFCDNIDTGALRVHCSLSRRWNSSLPYSECCSIDRVGAENAACDPPDDSKLFNLYCHQKISLFHRYHADGVTVGIYYLCVQPIIFIILLVIRESNFISRISHAYKQCGFFYYLHHHYYDRKFEPSDEDVQQEQERCAAAPHSNVLCVVDLQRKFKRYQAVRNLTFGVKKGECMGILGVDGAGVTTTFQMLAGTLEKTGGYVSVVGRDLVTDRGKYLRSVGYSPQTTCILPQFTGTELLHLICKTRGLTADSTISEIEYLTKLLQLGHIIDKCSGEYPDVSRRKLQMAMCMVGKPDILLIDDPYSGLDPDHRSIMFQSIQRILGKGHSVLLASSRIEDLEGLCDRVCVMVSGTLRCIGTAKYLKEKYTSGFTLSSNIRIKESTEDEEWDKLEELIQAFYQSFSKGNIFNDHAGFLKFQISEQLPLHILFSKMDKLKKDWSEIREYYVRETKLEEVFSNIACQSEELRCPLTFI